MPFKHVITFMDVDHKRLIIMEVKHSMDLKIFPQIWLDSISSFKFHQNDFFLTEITSKKPEFIQKRLSNES